MADLNYSHCPWCGSKLPSEGWPRVCPLGHVVYCNSLPVAAVLVPVDDGLLVVRRADEKYRGRLAIPGGYVNHDETWQTAALRELFEESGVNLCGRDELRVFDVISTTRGHMVTIFGIAPPITAGELAQQPFAANSEVSERLVIHEPGDLAFPQDNVVVRRYFGG